MQKMKVVKYPLVHIETFSYCNSNCIFCGYHHMRREKGIMPRELFNKIIDEIATWSARVSITPHHYGEFFLQPEWFDLLKYIQDKAPETRITIATNGSILNDAKLDKLLKIHTLKSMCFSAYAFHPDTYKKIIGLRPDTLNKIKHAVIRISKERPDIEIVLGMAPTMLTSGECSLFIEHWNSLAELRIVPHVITCNHINSTLIDSGCSVACPDLFDTTIILHNGDVCGCCFDTDGEIHLGNMYKNSLLEIWNGERATEYRNMHLLNKRDMIPLCRSCTRPCDFLKLFRFSLNASP